MKYNSYRKSEGQVKGFIPHVFSVLKKREGFIPHHFSVSKRRGKGFTPHLFLVTKRTGRWFTPHLFSAFKKGEGFSTIEMLVAFAIMALAFTGILTVVFGNDNFAIDSQLNSEAMFYAERDLNESRKQAENDFLGFAGFTTTTDGGRYTITSTSTGLTECSNLLETTASWNPTTLRAQHVTLQSVVASIEEFIKQGNDCDPFIGGGLWNAPKYYENPEVIHPGSDATDVAVVKNDKGRFAFVTSLQAGNHSTFWVIDVTDPDNLSLAAEFGSSNGIDGDLTAVDTLADGDIVYAFTTGTTSSTQLTTMRVDFFAYPGSAPTITAATSSLPEAPSGDGRSVYFYDSKVYVGTQYLACPPSCAPTQNHEFHIFDATSDPSHPVWEASLNLNHNINDIFVRNNFAYLAVSDNNGELMLVNIDPGSDDYLDHPDTAGYKFNAQGNQDATAIWAFGNRAYLGRRGGNGTKDFYVLNTSNPSGITEINSVNLDINNDEVVGLALSGSLAFLATSDQSQSPSGKGGPFIVYNIDEDSDKFLQIISTCPLNFSEQSSGLDFMENTAYVANQASDAVRILYPSPTCNP